MNTLTFRPRDYTLLGLTGLMDVMTSTEFAQVYGERFNPVVSYLNEGMFYMGLDERQRGDVSTAYLQTRMNEKEFEQVLFSTQELSKKYFSFIEQPARALRVEDILPFYTYYHDLILLVYPSIDAIDFLHVLPTDRRESFSIFSNKLRLLAESIYKRGEEEFVPKIAEVIANKFDISSVAVNITCHEIRAFLQQGIPLLAEKNLCARTQSFLYIQTNKNEYHAFTGIEASTKARELGFTSGDSGAEVSEFVGTSAFGGVVRGKVCVVVSKKQIENVTEGCVLVASMTQPSYLPAMKKAVAFVTDEGGMLCHAAIIAREMKKPCIIGTKIATQALIDGDFVEVDADSGIVKKLS